MSAAVSVAPRGERKAVAAALKQAAADPDTPTGAAQLDLENGNGAAEDSDLKPQYPPKWQYFRSLAWIRPAIILFALYCVGLVVLYALFSRLPNLQTLEALARQQGRLGAGGPGEVAALRLALPHSMDELRAVRRTVELYRQNYGRQLALLLGVAYLFLQAFMIPGSVGINILAGSMYSFPVALLFVGVTSTVGACLNYWLSRLLLKDMVVNLIPQRVQAFSQEVRRHRAHLLNYMLFLRATPLLPGWFISLASPIVGVPFPTFLIASGVGHQPINFVTVQAGRTLAEIHSMRDLYSPRNVAFMLLIGLCALVPVALKWQQQRRKKPGGSGAGGGGSGSNGGAALPGTAAAEAEAAAAAAHKL